MFYIPHLFKQPSFIKQVGSTDADLLQAAKGKMPILWFTCGDDNFAVVVEGHVFRQKSELESFFTYFSSFSVFDVDWCSQ